MKIDIELTLNNQNIYDIDFTNGDFSMTEGFDTALIMSVFCEKRANNSEVPAPQFQRGWWGNLYNDVINYEQGSKIWLLYQARLTQDNLNRAIAYLQDCLQWLIDDEFADRISCDGDFVLNGISLFGKIYRNQDIVGSFSYELWQGTGVTNAA